MKIIYSEIIEKFRELHVNIYNEESLRKQEFLLELDKLVIETNKILPIWLSPIRCNKEVELKSLIAFSSDILKINNVISNTVGIDDIYYVSTANGNKYEYRFNLLLSRLFTTNSKKSVEDRLNRLYTHFEQFIEISELSIISCIKGRFWLNINNNPHTAMYYFCQALSIGSKHDKEFPKTVIGYVSIKGIKSIIRQSNVTLEQFKDGWMSNIGLHSMIGYFNSLKRDLNIDIELMFNDVNTDIGRLITQKIHDMCEHIKRSKSAEIIILEKYIGSMLDSQRVEYVQIPETTVNYILNSIHSNYSTPYKALPGHSKIVILNRILYLLEDDSIKCTPHEYDNYLKLLNEQQD